MNRYHGMLMVLLGVAFMMSGVWLAGLIVLGVGAFVLISR